MSKLFSISIKSTSVDMSLLMQVLILLILLGGLSVKAYAQGPIKLYAFALKERLSVEGGLGYNKVMDAIFKDMDEDIEIVIAPLKRVRLSFEMDRQSCSFPANEIPWVVHSQDPIDMRLIASHPVDYVSIRAYTPYSADAILSKRDLHGKRVGYLMGSPAPALIKDQDKIHYHVVERDELLLQMLARKRVDVILGFHPDTAIMIDRLGDEQARSHRFFNIGSGEVGLLCHDTPRNHTLINHVNRRLDTLKASGKLRQYLGPHAVLIE